METSFDITTYQSLQEIVNIYGADHILGIRFDSDIMERYIPGEREFSMDDVVEIGGTYYIKCLDYAMDKKTGKRDIPIYNLSPMQTIHHIWVVDPSMTPEDMARIDYRFL